MERDDVSEFLRKMGMRDDQQATSNQWDRVIQPNSSYLIVGDVGTGKSALAYYLLETFSQKYNLLPAVVGLPREKQELLPSDFVVKDSPTECTELENSMVFIDEADLQLPIEDTKARQYVVNFLSLPRHRKQIFLLAFHFPRLVMGRYLPFFSAFLLKRPPYLIEFAGKRQNDALTEMMRRAEERFCELPNEEDVVKHTYVVAPRIRWQGMLENPLCSFWRQGLSEVWAGTEIKKPKQPQRKRWGTTPEEVRPEAFAIEPIYDDRGIIGFKVNDPEGSVIRKRASLVAEIHKEYPGISIGELEDARISYYDYHAEIQLKPRQTGMFPKLEFGPPHIGTIKGWLADDPEMKAIYPITPEIARQSVPIGALDANGQIIYGEQNIYQNSGYVVMENKETRLRWIKQIY